MIANIISRHSYTLSDTLTVVQHSISCDSDYGGKSQIMLARKPVAAEDDFVLLNDGVIVFQGIISAIENEKDHSEYTITLLEMQTLFDQKIVLADESFLKTGIEDFIAAQIRRNWIMNEDQLVNTGYLNVTAVTHTPIAAKVDVEDGGIYNLCTYIGNVLTNYGIFVDFEFAAEYLAISIEKKEQTPLLIDTGIPQVINLTEQIDVKALTKLTVVWQKTVNEVTTESIRHFFLRTDRTITENMNDPERAKGTTDVIVSKAEDEATMIQEARDKFTGNSYNHKIEFDLVLRSKLIDATDIYVGHKCTVKTASGIRDSIITATERANSSSVVNVKLGNLKVTLIEKVKGVEKKK